MFPAFACDVSDWPVICVGSGVGRLAGPLGRQGCRP
jgi:hypothetical protein